MSNNASKTVFVTGGSGFIGYTILTQLLNAGYHVRATARGAKAALLKEALSAHYEKDNFEVLNIPDLFSTDLGPFLKGVYGVIHVAAPLPGRAGAAEVYKIAEQGSLHIAEEALKAGVKRLVVTSSVVTWPGTGPYGVDDWNPITKAEAGDHPLMSYVVGKKIEDETFLKFAKEHSEIDVSLIAPGTTFGPFPPGFERIIPEPNYNAFSTNGYIYRLLRPGNTHWPIQAQNGAIDVRDIARAHLLALESPPTSVVGTKRFPIISPHQSSYKTAIEIIAAERADLKDRLADPADAPVWPTYTLATKREDIEKAIGFEADSYTPWRTSVLETVDSLIKMEEYWRAKGFKVEVPDTPPL